MISDCTEYYCHVHVLENARPCNYCAIYSICYTNVFFTVAFSCLIHGLPFVSFLLFCCNDNTLELSNCVNRTINYFNRALTR